MRSNPGDPAWSRWTDADRDSEGGSPAAPSRSRHERVTGPKACHNRAAKDENSGQKCGGPVSIDDKQLRGGITQLVAA